jgi:hypothetical protein
MRQVTFDIYPEVIGPPFGRMLRLHCSSCGQLSLILYEDELRCNIEKMAPPEYFSSSGFSLFVCGTRPRIDDK